MKEKLGKNKEADALSSREKEEILRVLEQEAMEYVKENYPFEKSREFRTLFEYVLLGGTFPKARGILEKHIPVIILAGDYSDASKQAAKERREQSIAENGGYWLGGYSFKTGGNMFFYDLTLELKDLEKGASLDNVVFEGSKIINLETEEPVQDVQEKQRVIEDVFLRAEKRWEELREQEIRRYIEREESG